MFDGNLRTQVDRGLTPIGRSLVKTGITPDVITLIGIVMSGSVTLFVKRAVLGVRAGLGYEESESVALAGKDELREQLRAAKAAADSHNVKKVEGDRQKALSMTCLLYTSPSTRD